MENKLNELRERLGIAHDLGKAAGLLDWDRQVNMPPAGAEERAKQSATLSRLAHEAFTQDEVGRLLQDLEAESKDLPYDDDTASLIRITRRDYDKARRLPPAFVHELAHTTGRAMPAWTRARAESDFKQFEPHLEKIIELKRREADYLGYQDRSYDALLDQFEPGMTTAQVQTIFDQVRKELRPLLGAIHERLEVVDGSVLRRDYDEQKQWDFTIEALKQIGFDFERGRQDQSVHPFTSSFSNHDVRLTTRVDRNYFPMAFFGTLHEGGHGLYELGSPDEFERTPLAGGASYGTHESQSRMWENLVGRSRPFWRFFYPRFCATFAEAARGIDLETLYRAVNRVQPSYIRIKADEVTYNLHIMLRFQLETQLLEGKLAVAEVPGAWNATMQDLLDISPPDDAHGALQDVHWSIGAIGYFPTYSLGTFFSVQLFEKAREAIPDLFEQFARGEFGALLGWLRENIHRHGHKFTLNELATRITGEPLQTTSYLRYLKEKYTEIYDL